MTLYAKKASYINNKIRFKTCHISMYCYSADMCIWAKNFNVEFFEFNARRYSSEHILMRVMSYLFHLKASIWKRLANASKKFMNSINKYDCYLDANVQDITCHLFKGYESIKI